MIEDKNPLLELVELLTQKSGKMIDDKMIRILLTY
jgi:hypothetical protein